jgi:hypothetical protein
VRYLRGFAWFWWDFIVGDSLVLAVGTVASLVAAYLLAHFVTATLAEVVLPVGVLATLCLALRDW